LTVDTIREKKGEDIVIIDLMQTLNSPCSFFVICTARSQTQINAIADHIQKNLQEKLDMSVWKEEGRGSNWRLLDYSDVVIHIFKEETRNHYNLEELWGDGNIKKIE
jgi:ribosome-associated protein